MHSCMKAQSTDELDDLNISAKPIGKQSIGLCFPNRECTDEEMTMKTARQMQARQEAMKKCAAMKKYTAQGGRHNCRRPAVIAPTDFDGGHQISDIQSNAGRIL